MRGVEGSRTARGRMARVEPAGWFLIVLVFLAVGGFVGLLVRLVA
jgi:hypothetical protein